MALGFSSYDRMERMLLKTRHKLGEDDAVFRENNKAEALQYASAFYNLYAGDGSETVYIDAPGLTIMQSELIATKAAIELTKSAISYYKDDVVNANAGPASASFRGDKLNWLRALLEELKEKLEELEKKLGFDSGEGSEDITSMMGLLNEKGLACADPPEDKCPEDFGGGMGGGCC